MRVCSRIVIVMLMIMFTSCDDSPECPEGMHECELNDGEIICVPDGLGC